MEQLASVRTKSGSILVNGGMEYVTQYDRADVVDEDVFGLVWDSMLDDLKQLMKRTNEDNTYWLARVVNFGWRKTNGIKAFEAKTPQELLTKVLPLTDSDFKIFFRETDYDGALEKPVKEIVIQNWHHDNPTGDEHYYIRGIEK